MGYEIKMTDSDFRIKNSNVDSALQALKQFVKNKRNTFINVTGVENSKTLDQAISHCRFDLELSTPKSASLPTKEDILKDVEAAMEILKGNRSSGMKAIYYLDQAQKKLTAVPEDEILVSGIYFNGEKQDGTEGGMFQAIAPFVEPESFIEMQGEEGEMWRWIFDGVNCIEKNGKITF